MSHANLYGYKCNLLFFPLNLKSTSIFLETNVFKTEFERSHLHTGEFTDPVMPGVVSIVLNTGRIMRLKSVKSLYTFKK